MEELYLKQIKLRGFKNFSKETNVDLQKKINIVFGPSDCGKSNLLSSINWIFSDIKMPVSSILFQGNEVFHKAEFAEVSLIYGVNENLSDEDIIIKRRLEKNGNERFFFNNDQFSNFTSFIEQINKFHLPALYILDDFDKNKKHRKTSKIFSDIESRSQGSQTVVVLKRNKNIRELSKGGLIGITFTEGSAQAYCLSIIP